MSEALRSPKKLRVMIAEHDDTYARRLGRALRPRYELERASSVKEAANHPHRDLADIVLLDLELATGDVDPYVFVRSICDRYPHAAVIVTSADETRRLRMLARRAGAKDYISKSAEVGPDLRYRIEDAYAIHESELRRRVSGDSMIAPAERETLMSDLHKMMQEVVREESRRPKTDVFDSVPMPLQSRLKAFLAGNWKFLLAGLISVSVYLVDFRDKINNFTSDIEEFQSQTSDAVESNTVAIQQLRVKQESDIRDMRKAVTRVHVLSVESTTQLQREIRAANPKVSYPEDTPALRRAKDQVRELKAAEAVFDGSIDEDAERAGEGK